MYENQQIGALAAYGMQPKDDPFAQMTCGENLERKIAEQEQRLAALKTALEEMKSTGLYNVKISTLRDTMTW